jgi:hypothetical protein
VNGTRAIERVTEAEFLRRLPELRATGHPVIISGLFRDSALASTATLAGARELLSAERMAFSERYVDQHLDRVRRYVRGVPMPHEKVKRRGTMGEFFDLAAEDGGYYIAEQPTPEKLLADIDLSALGVRSMSSGNADPYEAIAPDVAHSAIFVAGPQSAADAHSDGDGRDVLLYQCFGRKRVCLIPAGAGPVLHPIAVFGTVRLGAMTDAERAALLDYTGGLEAILEPGEAVFMPAFIWHHLDYLELSMSVNFRFGGIEDALGQELIRRVPINQYTQRIIVGTRDPGTAEYCRAAAREVLAIAARSYPSARAKYRAVYEGAARHAPAGTGATGSRYLDAYVEAEYFLDGGLSGFYSRSPDGPGHYDRRWHLRERVRDAVRRRARQVAYWA